jgi:helicase
MFQEPDEFVDRIAYEEFLGEVKTAWVLKSWMEETSEDEMIETFRIEPGDLYRLTSTAEWLLYASFELAKLLGHKDVLPKTAEIRERMLKGAKAELLLLTRLKGVGRARARVMYDVGLKTFEDLKRVPLSNLIGLPLIGTAVAKKIKEQVGGYVKQKEWNRVSKNKGLEQQALMKYFD